MIPTSTVTSGPAIEPVTAAQVKDNAFIINDTQHDNFIDEQLIPHARATVEELAKRSLITQTRVQRQDCLETVMYLRYGPVQSVTSITYKDSTNTTQTLASSKYTVDTASIPARVVEAYNQTYPSSNVDTNSVVITAIHGYGSTAASVPIIYRRAIILLATFWFNNRAAFACGDVDDAVMKAVEQLLAIEGRTLEYA